MSTLNWVPPLPPGFEARWDPNQRAYFYINHNTKQTSWIDPRPKYYAEQPKDHPPPNPRPEPPKTPVFGFRGSVKKTDESENKVAILKQQFPDVADDTLRMILKIKNGNIAEARNRLKSSGYKMKEEVDHSSAAQLHMENIIKTLQKQYPLARYDIIRDIVVGCNNNEASARSQLESMGYQKVGGHEPSSSAESSITSGSSSRPSTRSSTRSPSPTPIRVSEAEKRNITNKMKKEFKDLEDTFIKMGLDSVNYDESKFKRMVEHYKESQKSGRAGGSATGRKKVDDDISFKPSASLVPESFEGGNEPVVFGHDEEELKGESSSIPVETDHNDQHPTGHLKTRTSKFVVDLKGSSSKPKQKMVHTSKPRETIQQHAARLRAQQNQPRALQAQQNQPRAKQVTHTTTTHTHVVHTQPRSSLAKGPDPTLRKGPNKEHLLSEYVTAVGPNPDHYSGPDSSRVHGSQGAYGPDPSLVCGSQAQHANSYRTLVTAI